MLSLKITLFQQHSFISNTNKYSTIESLHFFLFRANLFQIGVQIFSPLTVQRENKNESDT